MTPQRSTIFCSVPSLLLVLAMKALVTPCGVSPHLIWPFKVQLTCNFFQDLVHGLSKHNANHPSSSRSGLPSKISSRSVIAISIRPKIPSILWDHLSFPFPLLLVFPDLLILVNAVHELMHTPNRLPCQRFSQIMLGG